MTLFLWNNFFVYHPKKHKNSKVEIFVFAFFTLYRFLIRTSPLQSSPEQKANCKELNSLTIKTKYRSWIIKYTHEEDIHFSK